MPLLSPAHAEALEHSLADVDRPITYDDIVERAVRLHIPLSVVGQWISQASRTGLLHDAGSRRHSHDGVHGSRQYLVDRQRAYR